MSRDSRGRTRPLIVASLENDDDYGMSVMSLVVKNWGPTVARGLKVGFEPDIVAQHVESRSTLGYVARRYLNEIPLLAPGAELKNAWRTAGDSEGHGKSAPKVVVASVSYRGTSRKRLRERFTLDAHAIEQGTGAGHPSVRASLSEIAEAVSVKRST